MALRLVTTLGLLGFLAMGATGCGDGSKVRTVPVSGKLQLDGAPLADAEINFLGEKYAGYAKSNSDGTYALEAQPGENKVYIRKFPPNFDPTLAVPSESGGTQIPGQLLPEKYSDPQKTELKFPVPENAATGADFALNSK